MWHARTKTDLVIEIWEKLDCESVGAAEIEAIETVVADVYGAQAVDSPMTMARLLADEGAVLRHSELMELYVKRASTRTFEPGLADLDLPGDLSEALSCLEMLERLRNKHVREKNDAALRVLRQKAIDLRRSAQRSGTNERADDVQRVTHTEIADWLTVWLQTPELFRHWIEIRRGSADFKNKFGTDQKHL